MTRRTRARPDVPNGKPPGRHVRTAWDVARDRSVAHPDVHAEGGEPDRLRIAVKVVAVMSVTSGIVGTIALPSYGVDPDELHAGGLRGGAGRVAEVQAVVVPASVRAAEAERHAFGATTMEELEAAREKERAADREFAAAKQLAIEAAAAGRQVVATAADQAAAQPAPAVADEPVPADDGSLVSVAGRYLGVPYMFGGASPSGFDCSGLVLFVFAQFGISLPHSSLQQAANGSRVAEPAPGDLVVLDGGNHIGIYTGNGNMIDAPMPGRVVNERPIYTANHYFVRY